VVNRTIYNLKTLQRPPTNGRTLKGLLTYRTIQFSMSSRSVERNEKILVTVSYYELLWVTAVYRNLTTGSIRLPTFGAVWSLTCFPFRGQKIREPIVCLSLGYSELQLSSRSGYPVRAGCQNLFGSFLPAGPRRGPLILPASSR
jgi:hypothetical protein